MRPVACLFSMMLLSMGCNEAKENTITRYDSHIIEAEVSTMLHDYFKAVEVKGLTAELFYLDSSKDFFWVPPGYNSWISYDSVVTALTQNDARYKKISNQWEYLRIYPIDENNAQYTGRINCSVIDTTDTHASFSLLETGMVKKKKSGWKLSGGQTQLITNTTQQ